MTCPLRGVAAHTNGVEAARGTLMTDDLTCNHTHSLQRVHQSLQFRIFSLRFSHRNPSGKRSISYHYLQYLTNKAKSKVKHRLTLLLD